MRLRLTVQRNGLPAANILWNVPETNSNQAYTVTRLLDDINHIIPLEAEHWGLEHYVVEVAGFECLHFMPVINALKEDDHVSIRPLMTAEVRARTLAGRDQISNAGQHLVDGVPFGRPYLRQPNRPAVRIPPRKRRRLQDAEVEDGSEAVGSITGNGEHSEKDAPPQPPSGFATSNREATKSRQPSKSVQFRLPEADISTDSEEDDEDFAPDGVEEDEASSNEDSEEGSDSDSDSDALSSASDSSGSDSESTSDSDASSPPDILSSKGAHQPTPTFVPPGEGRATTKARNSRRVRVARLRHLKALGYLHEDANLSDLKAYEEAMSGHAETPSHQPFSKSTGKRKRLDQEESSYDAENDITEFERKKQELMARFGDTASATEATETPVEPDLPSLPDTASITTPSLGVTNDEQPVEKEKPTRRLRPDTSAIARILTRQAKRTPHKTKDKPVDDEVPESEGASDPDFWKSRINLSAFECWEEDFDLTAPPFPFKQHWDPNSKLMRDKAAKKRQKKQQNSGPAESLPVENEEEEKIFLNYDESPEPENPDSDIHAAIENQLRQDVATATQSDLPPLPDDTSTLPDLTSSDMKVGAIIACKFFNINPVTMTPEISNYKTAIVKQEGDSGPGAGTIQLEIAERDLPKREKKFDSKGNRIYEAADAFLMEDEDAEAGLWQGQFAELLEPKLLQAA